MLRQQGRCAECGETLPAVGTSWLGRTSSKASFQSACITRLLDGYDGRKEKKIKDYAFRHQFNEKPVLDRAAQDGTMV